MLQQREAIIRLLQDPDPQVVEMVKEQLVSRGSTALADLRELLATDDESVARHARAVIAEIDARAAAAQMERLCQTFPARATADDLENACWLLARAMLPGTQVDSYRRQLDHWGERLASIAAAARDPARRVQAAADLLGRGLNFRGNEANYYDASNSLLPPVIDSRLGIPITLATIYLLVGHRAGIAIEGVNFPGHFLARHEGVLFDPFNRGRILTAKDCDEILERQHLAPNPSFLAAASPRATFARILSNLLYLFQNEKNDAEFARVSGWLQSLGNR